MNEQHNHHCLLSFGGFNWWITSCRKDRVHVARDVPAYVGTAVILAVIDTSHVDWSAYCATAAAWDTARDRATTKFEDLPIVPSPDPARTARKTRDWLIEEGRAAYRAGLGVDRCPPFKDNDMRIDWRLGWRWESEERPRGKC